MYSITVANALVSYFRSAAFLGPRISPNAALRSPDIGPRLAPGHRSANYRWQVRQSICQRILGLALPASAKDAHESLPPLTAV